MPESLLSLAGALEASPFGAYVRASSLLYPLANLLHVLGAALLVGAVATFDMALLRRTQGAGPILRAGIPVAAGGLLLAVAAGIVLFAAEAGPLVRNPAFLAKMGLILLGLANVAVFHMAFGERLKRGETLEGARPLALVSLGAWIAALLAGRAIAYV